MFRPQPNLTKNLIYKLPFFLRWQNFRVNVKLKLSITYKSPKILLATLIFLFDNMPLSTVRYNSKNQDYSI